MQSLDDKKTDKIRLPIKNRVGAALLAGGYNHKWRGES